MAARRTATPFPRCSPVCLPWEGDTGHGPRSDGGGSAAVHIVPPRLGPIQLPVHQRPPATGGLGGEHADLAVLGSPGGSQKNNMRARGALTWDVKSLSPQVNSLRAPAVPEYCRCTPAETTPFLSKCRVDFVSMWIARATTWCPPGQSNVPAPRTDVDHPHDSHDCPPSASRASGGAGTKGSSAVDSHRCVVSAALNWPIPGQGNCRPVPPPLTVWTTSCSRSSRAAVILDR